MKQGGMGEATSMQYSKGVLVHAKRPKLISWQLYRDMYQVLIKISEKAINHEARGCERENIDAVHPGFCRMC